MRTTRLPDGTALQSIEQLSCDAFERRLLPIARHFLSSFESPEHHAWHRAYSIAAEQWQETLGLSIAHHLQKVIRAILRCRTDGIAFQDPLCPEARAMVTVDERMLIDMLHSMRRDHTEAARNCVEALTHGRMDPDVIRTGLSFAARFSVGPQGVSYNGSTSAPILRLVR